jgi:HNH endonuclease
MKTIKERILTNVIILESGCWEWQKYVEPNGYGVMGVGPKVCKVHRVSYEEFIGPIPDGKELDHTCHTTNCPGGPNCRHRRCANPYHLEPVTRKVNVSRGHGNSRVVSNRKAKTHCFKGHAYDEANTYWYRGYRVCRACHLATETSRANRLKPNRLPRPWRRKPSA